MHPYWGSDKGGSGGLSLRLWGRSYRNALSCAIEPERVKEVTNVERSGAVIAIDALAAQRGVRMLFEGLSFRAVPGEVVELRGPNGSGKSTLLRIMAGLTRPYSGSFSIGSGDQDAPRHYLGHADGVKPNETALEQVCFWARFFGQSEASAHLALERMGLKSRARVPGRGLSAGQRRRLALTRLLLDDRPVWLLDEPVSALDAEGRVCVETLIAEHASAGGIVVAAMHGPSLAGARLLDLSAIGGSSPVSSSGARVSG